MQDIPAPIVDDCNAQPLLDKGESGERNILYDGKIFAITRLSGEELRRRRPMVRTSVEPIVCHPGESVDETIDTRNSGLRRLGREFSEQPQPTGPSASR